MTRDIDWFAAAQRAYAYDEGKYQAELDRLDELAQEAELRMGPPLRRREP